MSPYVSAVSYFAVTTIVVLAAVFIFDLLETKYKVWDEIGKGNMAVAMAAGGKIFGVANIMHYAILSNDSLLQTLLWGGTGTVLLMAVYFGFELLTPRLKVGQELAHGNRAVGLLSLVFSVAFSFIIGASIS